MHSLGVEQPGQQRQNSANRPTLGRMNEAFYLTVKSKVTEQKYK